MSKFTDAVVTALKLYFETDDVPPEAEFAELLDKIQQGIEEHDHLGVGDGDAAKVDHGAGLSGLTDDDHTQYLLAAGTRVESVAPGHRQLLGAETVAGVAVEIIANGATDVTAGLYAIVLVKPSTGAVDYGATYCANNSSVELFNDGTDVLTLAVAADGSATLQRTVGSSLTFDVTLEAIWQ